IWLEHTEPLALSQDRLAVAAGSDFAAEWIEDKYGDLLTDVAERVFGRAINLSFQHQTRSDGTAHVRPTRAEAEALTERSSDQSQSAPAAPLGPPPGGVVFGSPLNERYSFERFVVGANNQLSAAACRAVAEAPARM